MSEEHDHDAAEFVLGTLPADERARVVGRIENDPAFAEAVKGWRARLAPLDETADAVAPSPNLWNAIERSVEAPLVSASSSNVIVLHRRLAAWRGAALAASALAAALAVVTVIDRLSIPPAPTGGRYVAVVDSGGHEPALIAEVDTTTGTISVRSLAAVTPAGRSLELWHIPEGRSPRSLGVLKAAGSAQTIRDAVAAGPVDGVIAVTVEPEGGSPSGAPTGPVVYTGRLIPAE